jgi:predicted Zn-dependent peptidase
MFMIYGDVAPGYTAKEADDALLAELSSLLANGVTENDVERVINNVEAQIEYEMLSVPEVATNLCFYAMFDKPERINEERKHYRQVNKSAVDNVARQLMREENATVLYYVAAGQMAVS